MDLKRGIFQGDSLSPLLFVLCLIPSTVILHKSENAYQFSRKRHYLLFKDDLKLYAKNERVWIHLFRQYVFSVMILSWNLG